MNKELEVSRILSGCIKCKIHNSRGELKTLLLKSPTLYYRYLAEELYEETLKEGQLQGLQSSDEVIDMMCSQGIWSTEKQSKLDQLIKDIEELKVKMYQLTFKSDEKRVVRAVCKAAKDDVHKLQDERNTFIYLSFEGAAHLAKVRYLIGMSLYHLNGKQFFSEASYCESSCHIVDEAIEFYNLHRLKEQQLRELARNDPWRGIWSCRKEDGLFKKPAIELTEEQKSLVIWSNIYDNIHKHPECPPESIIEDDDVLDGWMIIQRRKRSDELDKNKAEGVVSNEKVRNSGEIFIPANNKEDAKNIDKLNDTSAQMLKRQRLAYLNRHGEVNEVNMPDTKLEIQTEVNKMYVARGKNG